MDIADIQPLLDWLSQNQQWVAFAVFFISFLESLAIAGVVIPGVVLLFGAAAVAGTGALGLWLTLICAFSGAVLGDVTSFFLGKIFKNQIKDLWPFRNHPDWIARGERYFAEHGGKSVIIGRFVGPIRPILPLVAGMMDMPSSRFITINLLSALAWAPVYILPGYSVGASLHWTDQLPIGLDKLLLIAALIAVIGALIYKRIR